MLVDSNFCIHFVGIGGIGVSGIAEIMHSLGYSVKGSDWAYSSNIDRLGRLGIQVTVGHDPSNIDGANIVVFSSAIKDDNPELIAAKTRGIPILTRAEMLSQLVRFKKSIVVSGSHGKTTVTSLCSSVLELAAFNPTTINGGIINAYQTNAKLGTGEWAVIESDESDGSFVRIFPTIGIITNIDREHINHYGSFDNLKKSFAQFLDNLPFFGYGIVCVDDVCAAEVAETVIGRKIVTYSISKKSNVRAINIQYTSSGSLFDAEINIDGKREIIENFTIPILGPHNILNSLAAITTAYLLKIDVNIVKTMLSSYLGVNRRFTRIGSYRGVKFIDDYAHHPTEIRSVLDSVKQILQPGEKSIVVCQPHRFTRLNNLFDEFVEILSRFDFVIIMPVYRADNSDAEKFDSMDLYNAISLEKQSNTFFANDETELLATIQHLFEQNKIIIGDIIVFAGAGNISKFGHFIFDELAKTTE